MVPHGNPITYDSIMVTGASGFVGQYLLLALAERWPQAALHATTRGRFPSELAVPCRWHSLDVQSAVQVEELLTALRPNVVIHLAAQSHVPTSFQEPMRTWQTNLDGTLNLLEGVRRRSPDTLVLNVGSADMYGGAFRESVPLDEQSPFIPLNPYAASKAAADLAAGQYAESYGLRIIRARSFNHTGPGQSDDFVLASFAGQIAAIEKGLKAPVMQTGNLDAERDFLDVSDVVKAYLSLLSLPEEKQAGNAYNIARGNSVSIDCLLHRLLAHSRCEITTQLDLERQRPSDISRVSADVSALRIDTGWCPNVSVDDMLLRLLNDCRKRLDELPI